MANFHENSANSTCLCLWSITFQEDVFVSIQVDCLIHGHIHVVCYTFDFVFNEKFALIGPKMQQKMRKYITREVYFAQTVLVQNTRSMRQYSYYFVEKIHIILWNVDKCLRA